jgi:type I restriction-modification system DNA methylase subunit
MTNCEAAYSEIEKLTQKFKATTARQRKNMNEHATRQGYILPMFRALGWDIDNINEVSPEEKVSRGFVDFSFRIGGVPRYFLETKRADEDLNNPLWVRQTIDYAWTKSVTWALLSDFEGTRVFNAEWKEDNPFRALFFEFNLETYLSDFERLWWLSREQTALGKLDKEGQKVGRSSKRLPVSQELFGDLKKWRELLYNDFKLYNPILPPGDIDNAILHLLNRLIFIRTAEDRHVEPIRLRAFVRELKDRKQFNNWGAELSKLFRELDGVYNSELFAPHFSDGLEFSPSILEQVIDGLYEKHYIHYNFNALEADVLGTVYEQYLGAVVADKSEEVVKPKKGAKQPELISEGMTVQERRKKRKSQGIYYTPSFVTKYIVQQTVGKYLEENGYNPSRPPRILDMACGSGSFLIEAFDVMDRFVMDMRHQNSEFSENSEFLARTRQLEVLENCIYGVDKDKQAVEVARLNLLLRALHSREKLPKLKNFHLGDSLHPETWEMGFPEVMKDGGFDIIIGNPPYVRQETLGEEFKAFAKQNFETYAGTADLYIYFIEQAHKLLKPNGYFGMIVSNKWMRSNYGKALREFLTKNAEILEVIDFGEMPVFGDVLAYPVIIITRRRSTQQHSIQIATIKNLDFISLSDEVKKVGTTYQDFQFSNNNWNLTGNESQSLLAKILAFGEPLGKFVNNQIYRGLLTGLNEAFIVEQPTYKKIISNDKKAKKLVKPFLMGRDVHEYFSDNSTKYLICIPRGFTDSEKEDKQNAWAWFKKTYPSIVDHLSPFEDKAKKRLDKGDYWWELRACDYYDKFALRKIIAPAIVQNATFTIDSEGFYSNDKTSIIMFDSLYVLGILNSKISDFVLKQIASTKQGGYFEQKPMYISQIPIRRIDFDNPAEKSAHDEIVSLVEKMLSLQKEHQSFQSKLYDDEIKKVEREIAHVDKEIDQRVYQLYGLTEEEIIVVEGK